jgi:hypothetical protein
MIISHENHDFGFIAELNQYQTQRLVQFAARQLGEFKVKLIVQVIDGELSLDFGGDVRKALITPVVDSEVTAHEVTA